MMTSLLIQPYRSLAPKYISSGYKGCFLHKLSPLFTRSFTSSTPRNLFPKKRYWAYLCTAALTGICLQQTYADSKQKETNEEEVSNKWVVFNEKLQDQTKGKILPPFEPVQRLALQYLQEPSMILDIGCETGKNAAYLIKKGHKVVLLDIAPNAVTYTIENLTREGLGVGIQDSIVAKIEDLPPEYGPFKAVVGTYAFSFISPHLFSQTMKENVLKRVSEDGYFVGGFFGKEHTWAVRKHVTIVSTEELQSLFASQGFSILEMNEQIKEQPTVSHGITKFHTIHIIAHKTLNSS